MKITVSDNTMKILVIDDWSIIARSVERCFPDASVAHEFGT
jgi:hypothetical protein